ncbi:hypothetical protein [Clostridium sp. DJ247]|uniref:hypothetical protein n=1 Tax=Clostridium sp. DJ247 TaxID=2726188 RepID=UPI001629F82F|nr:hypothetical protein [Clostridium sp. DJ247]MBC2582080.1 hypothetical protein [Clostridium sp. DJ247]
MDINNILILNKLSNIEKEVLSYIYQNINYPDKLKVKDVAKSNFTSTTTVMRVTKKLGYSGYKEMYLYL